MAGRFTIEAVFKGINEVSAPVTKMQNDVAKFTNKFNRGIRSVSRVTNEALGGLKKFAAVGVVVLGTMTAAIADVSKVGSGFETAMVRSTAKMKIFNRHSGEGFIKFQKLSNQTRELGLITEFTATQAAMGLDKLAMAGFTVDQALSTLPELLDLATAGSTEVALAADIATDALGAFNMMADDNIQMQKNMARVSNVLAAVVNDTNTDLEMMFETIKKGSAVAKGGGGDIETFAAIAGRLASSALKASGAGTAMKSMFSKMAAPSTLARKLLKQFNIQTMDSEGNLMDMIDILGQMEGAFKDLGSAQKLAILKELFGERGMVGANILLNEGIENVKEYRETLRNLEGTTKKLAAVMRDTFGVEWLNLIALIEDAKIQIFELIKEPLKALFKDIKTWVKGNQDLIKSIASLFNFFIRHAKLIAKISIAVGIMIGALTALSGVLGLVSAAMLVFNILLAANPIVLIILAIVAAITALVAIGAVVVMFWDEWGESIKEMSPELKILIGFLTAVISPLLNQLYILALLATEWGDVSKEIGIAVSFIEGEFKSLKAEAKSLFDFLGKGSDVFQFLLNPTKFALSDTDLFSKYGSKIAKNSRSFFGGSDEADQRDQARTEAGVVRTLGPEATLSKEIRESRQTNELTIRDETGRAELTKGNASDAGLTIIPTGAF